MAWWSPSRKRGPSPTTPAGHRRTPLAHPLPEPLALKAVALGLQLRQASFEAGVALQLGDPKFLQQ